MTLTPMCLGFLLASDPSGGREVLLGRKNLGFGAGKIVGLGGHVETGEDARAATVREIREESGLEVAQAAIEHAATIIFRFPSKPVWDQQVEVFTSTAWAGLGRASDEITPEWHPVDRLPLDEMWDDARYWLPQVLQGQRLQADITFAGDCATVASAKLSHPA